MAKTREYPIKPVWSVEYNNGSERSYTTHVVRNGLNAKLIFKVFGPRMSSCLEVRNREFTLGMARWNNEYGGLILPAGKALPERYLSHLLMFREEFELIEDEHPSERPIPSQMLLGLEKHLEQVKAIKRLLASEAKPQERKKKPKKK